MALSFDKRDLTPGCLIHVYNRGNNKMIIYKSNADYKWFLNKAEYLRINDHFDVIAFCLMPNHFHFLLNTKTEDSLSKFFHRLQLAYAKYFNRKYSHSGHVFGGPFKTDVFRDEHHVTEIARYIHMNPVSAGLITRPENWKWSNYKQLINYEIDLGSSFYSEIYGGFVEYKLFVESQLKETNFQRTE
ncbi:MAG: transposase [Candidatus Marinimicrobia bacterium]|nr:transposase [FCB group bacterium]MBL7025144.1 transposase [Candidatus Neomarinimicrobiota bacterium]